MQRPDIIGLTGLAGTGKDTVALILKTHLRFVQLAFADPVRSEICNAFSVPLSLFTDRSTKEKPTYQLALLNCTNYDFTGLMLKNEAQANPTCKLSPFLQAPQSPRQLMQWWGTDYRRNTTHDAYWTRHMIARIRAHQEGDQWRTVVSDVRYDNEADTIRKMGGQLWHITRPGVERTSQHSSATDGSQFKADLVINNAGDMHHLRYLVIGAWLQHEASLTAHDVMRMGLAYEAQASADYRAGLATPAAATPTHPSIATTTGAAA